MGTFNEQLARWMDTALERVTPSRPQHVHLDELGAAGHGGRTLLRLADEAYAFVLERLGPRCLQVKALLLIPLQPSEALRTLAPTPEQLVSELGEEPPSLYLLTREVDLFLDIREEYRIPYLPTLTSSHRPDVFTWYRVHRGEEAWRNGWEYERAVLAEHYPARFRFTPQAGP